MPNSIVGQEEFATNTPSAKNMRTASLERLHMDIQQQNELDDDISMNGLPGSLQVPLESGVSR